MILKVDDAMIGQQTSVRFDLFDHQRELLVPFLRIEPLGLVVADDEYFQSILRESFQPIEKRVDFTLGAIVGEITGVKQNVAVGEDEIVVIVRVTDADKTGCRRSSSSSSVDHFSHE